MTEISTEFKRDALRQLQSLPLEGKIILTQKRISEWYDHWDGQVYVSFSGGKDSTVLKHIVDSMYDDVTSVFVDTGLEFPEVRRFAVSQPNVTVIRPEMRFDKVIKTYGYPVASKEVSQMVREARIGLARGDGSYSYRIAKLRGEHRDKNGNLSMFNQKKWEFLLDAPFLISEKCCYEIKKKPSAAYERATGKKPIIGMMASESRLRQQRWLRYGCNAFGDKRPSSNPLSFWTEQDILEYLRRYSIPYASVYGEIVETENGLTTTGRDRTGCMYCMYGAQCDAKPNRFQQMQKTHPRQYAYCMKPVEEGGLGLEEVLEYLNIPYESDGDPE